jgi:hypothetical protein
MEFFLKGLNPFKFQTKFKCSFFPEILISILLGIWTSPQKESCSLLIKIPPSKVWKILENRKLCFSFFQTQLG